jgi:hypothetical protein
MESRFGYDFSQVRVHTDAKAAESAKAVNAVAYTVGHNVVFGARQYSPKTSEGKRLLTHELTHVVQQSHQIPAALPSVLLIEPIDSATELEADWVAQQIATNALATRDISQHILSVQRTPGPCSTRAIRDCTDEDLLTAVCIGEAGNIGDRDGKKGVINVAVNRVPGFGATISDVVTARGQFKGLNQGIRALNTHASAPECRELAKEVIDNPRSDPTLGAVFFNQSCEKPCDQYCTTYLGDGSSAAHYFARRATSEEQVECNRSRARCSKMPRCERHCCDYPRTRISYVTFTEEEAEPTYRELLEEMSDEALNEEYLDIERRLNDRLPTSPEWFDLVEKQRILLDVIGNRLLPPLSAP